ncbi:MAG: helix-turn-helix transcriptional regulator [Actinomycetes bacterium]
MAVYSPDTRRAAEERPPLSVVPDMMDLVPPEQASRSPLVGRADELARLAALVGLDTGEPAAAAVLLAGDAGVGKTRLLAELRSRAVSGEWQVMVGHCLDFGDSALPYLPFSEAFGRLVGEVPALADALVAANPPVARLMPRQRRADADVDGESQHARIDRSSLFEAVQAALAQVARSRPLLLLVEDVHWADQSTRDLLSFLFARDLDAPVAVVASYRSDDLHRRHPLRPAAAEWSRLPGVHRLQLRPLVDDDIRTLVRSLHPAPLPERDVRSIVDRAEGNAFFTEELVAAAELGGRSVPTDLADLLLVRLDRLDDAARLVVRAGSVAGRRVSHDLLARVVDLDAATLDLALRAAVESNVLVSVGADGYAFRHALLAEAVYDDLLPGERVRLHGAYATMLAQPGAEGTAAELARHARAAHDLPTATRASIRAGDEAMAVAGPIEAAQHYEMALELIGDGSSRSGDGADDIDVVGLATRATEAAAAAGHVFRAVALAQDALRALPDDAPAEDRARLLHALVATALVGDTGVDVLALAAEALRLVPEEPPTPLRAQVTNTYARALADLQRDDDATRWAEDALGLGRVLGLADVAADASTTLAKLGERSGNPEAALARLDETVKQAEHDGEVAGELRGLFNLGGLHYELGHIPEALAVYRRAMARARETGRQWAPYGLDARLMVTVVQQVAGDWDDAARLVDVTGESPPGMAEAVLAAVGLGVSAGRGQTAALDQLPQLRGWWHKGGMIAILVGAAAIDLHGDRGDLVAARAVYDDAVATVAELWQLPWFQARIRFSGLLLGQVATEAARSGSGGSADRAELARLGDQLAAAARSTADKGRVRGRRRGPEGVAWLARVEAEHNRLRWLTGVDPPPEDELVGSWEQTVEAFDTFGHVFEAARSRARLSAVLRAVGRGPAAAEQAELARAVARRLGAEPLLAELRLAGGADPSDRRAKGRDETLTAREHEVLALVAQGRSNREIAGQLFISAKTVSVHVSNILAKLGAGGRTEAVAIARRRHLLADD